MRGSPMALVAAAALLAGVAGCSLPEVLPMAGGPTAGPSPYGPWYEQHWATNAVLLAASDQPEGETAADDFGVTDEAAGDEAAAGEALGEPSPVEASAGNGEQASDFSNSTPYQFPSSSFAPAPPAVPAQPAPAPPADAAPRLKAAPTNGGPIRY